MRNPGFSFLCRTIVSVSFTKEGWTQKPSGILLNYCYFFFNWNFFWVTFWAVGRFLGQGLA